MPDSSESIKVYATEAEADALYMKRAETDAKGIAQLLGLTVQRIYQLEKEGVIARTASGHYNIADTVAAYNLYKTTGEILPPSSTPGADNGYFMEITEDTTVNAAQLAAILGITPTHLERLAGAGVFPQQTQANGIAEHLGIPAIMKLPLREILQAHGEPEEAIANAERKRDALAAAVKTADSMTPSSSKWELFAIQDSFAAFIGSLPADIIHQIQEGL